MAFNRVLIICIMLIVQFLYMGSIAPAPAAPKPAAKPAPKPAPKPTPKPTPKAVAAAPKKGATARSEYVSILADYYYDAEVEAARAERADRLLKEERRTVKRAKEELLSNY
mmetsp:Transcript_30/g.14  ORF Transcript_30/g.14 Transcript_30/m.14 type:complete len:111 (+) Transcript_30:11-343(+)